MRAAPARKLRRLPKVVLASVIILALLLLALRLALPDLVKRYVNRQLSRIPDYRAEVGAVDLHLWRGAYSIYNLKLQKLSGKVPVPFFDAPRAELSVQWAELLNGALVGRIHLEQPRLNFVAGEKEADSQTRVHSSWQDAVAKLFPLRINSFTVDQGELHFRNFHTSPKVDIFIDRLQASATNLTNSLKISSNRVAHLRARGRAQSQAAVSLDLDLDPFAAKPNFKLAASLERLAIVKLRDFFEAYANVDIKQGEFSVFSELSSSDLHFEGYIKPIVKDLQILSLKEDISNPLKLVWQMLVEAATQLFTNQRHDQLATQINLSGKFDKPDIDYWSMIGYLLSNAFVQALSPSLQPEENHAGTDEKREGD